MTRSLLVLALCAAFVGAQAPANDLCGGALPLVVGVNAVGTTVGAAAEGPACGAFAASVVDVFYTYTPAVDEACTLSRVGSGGLGVDRAAALAGSCGALTAVSCVAAFSGGTPLTWFGQAGTTYVIRLGTSSTQAGFAVVLTTAAPLANDDCSTPTVVSDGINPAAPAGASGAFFSSVGATSSLLPTGACGLGAEAFDVWFQYAAAIGGVTTFQTCTPSGFAAGSFTNTNLQVFTGACGALVEAACDANSCSSPANNSLATFVATAGATYLIRVSGTSASGSGPSAVGTFYLTVIPPPSPPANDDCLNATPLALGINAGTTLNASADVGGPLAVCASFAPATIDVWHEFTPAVDCSVVLTRSGGGAQIMGIYTGTCGSLTPFACTVGTTLSAVVLGGTSYRLRVGTTFLVGASYSIDYQCTPFPANDECPFAAGLQLGVYVGTTVNATPSVGFPVLCGGFGPSVIDVWHTFVAGSTATYVFTRTGVNSALFAVSTGCDSPTGDVGCGATVSYFMPQGQVAYLRVGTNAGSPYTVTITSSPSNDTILGAIPVSLGVNPSAPNGVDGSTFTNVGTSVALDTAGGTIPAPSCSVMTNDVYFSWVAPTTCSYTVSLCTPNGFAPGTLTDSMLQVLNGAGTAELGCNDDSCGLLSSATFSATGGSTYVFRVGSPTGGATGTFYVTVTPEPYAVQMSSVGTGTLLIQNVCGVPGNLYLNFFTLAPGAFPNGNWFGLTLSIYEIQYQMTAGVAPFFGFLDAAGQATYGPLFGAPTGITVYAVSLQFDLSGSFVAASQPVSFMIP